MILYSTWVLSRRVEDAYCAMWDVSAPSGAQRWRGLVWVAVTIAATSLVALLHGVARDSSDIALIWMVVAVVLAGFLAELACQIVLTAGQVGPRRLAVAATLVTVARIGVVSWTAFFVAGSLAEQASNYGPIGVVFSLFTWIFAVILATLAGTLLAERSTAEDSSYLESAVRKSAQNWNRV